MNRQLLYAGLGLFLGSILLNSIFDATTSQYGPDPLDGLWGPMAVIGIILVIVGAAKGGGGRPQQQQQSVVVYAGAPGDAAPAAPRMVLKCPTCGALNEANARYCQECGKPIPQPGAVGAPKRPPSSAGTKTRRAPGR
ncbi:MAG: zinc ribbon domain-containing protein [Euryarchaeota archaeon]|nr:zinc ribbon domain-containing protein [Euryarchaeota archaeon]